MGNRAVLRVPGRLELAVVEDEAGDHRGHWRGLAPGSLRLQGERLLEGDALAPPQDAKKEESWPTKGRQQPSTGGEAASSRGGDGDGGSCRPPSRSSTAFNHRRCDRVARSQVSLLARITHALASPPHSPGAGLTRSIASGKPQTRPSWSTAATSSATPWRKLSSSSSSAR